MTLYIGGDTHHQDRIDRERAGYVGHVVIPGLTRFLGALSILGMLALAGRHVLGWW